MNVSLIIRDDMNIIIPCFIIWELFCINIMYILEMDPIVIAVIVIGLVLIIAVLIALVIGINNNNNNNTDPQVALMSSMVCMSEPQLQPSITFNQVPPSCIIGTTCFNSGGQSYFTDTRCSDVATDIFDGLGCNALPGEPDSRFCCFGPYALIPCPGITGCPITAPTANCEACPYPEVCQISASNPQSFNYDPYCIIHGGGTGCNWENDLGCRLCGGPNYNNVPCLYGPQGCTGNSGCTGGLICQQGMCVKGACTNSSECTGGLICVDGTCVTGTCAAGCPPGFICESNECVKTCCTTTADCGTTGFVCTDNICKHVVPKSITLKFMNQSGSDLLLGANGPTPVIPIEGTWVLPNGGQLNINVPPDWTQTAQAADCNDGVIGPRFWARTACEVGDPYWAPVIENVRDIVPSVITAARDPPENSDAGNGVTPGTYLVGTKFVNTDTGAIYYKSYGSKWVKINQTLYMGIANPDPTLGKLGDIYFQPTTSISTGNWYIKHQKAQCLSGNCGDSYDCSYNNFSGRAPTSLAEMCFDCGLGLNYYDVSLVDGYNLSVDIVPVGGSATNPFDPNDKFWGQTGLCINNIDLRSRPSGKFSLNASTLAESVPPSDYTIGVFSNCGFYEYPNAPAADCDASTDENCKYWRTFCCQSPNFGQSCTTDSDCNIVPDGGTTGVPGGACWNGKCQCRAYYKCQDTGPTPPSDQASEVTGPSGPQWIPRCCNEDVCFENRDPTAQPISGGCNTTTDVCIGDDEVHDVCPKAYSWPNDPTTFDTDAPAFIITFSPGGTNYGNVPAPVPIPLCSSLDPSVYNYSVQVGVTGFCGGSIQNGATYACAQKNFNGPWPCNVDAAGASCQGLGTLCRWN